jgi:hypothetical protein
VLALGERMVPFCWTFGIEIGDVGGVIKKGGLCKRTLKFRNVDGCHI